MANNKTTIAIIIASIAVTLAAVVFIVVTLTGQPEGQLTPDDQDAEASYSAYPNQAETGTFDSEGDESDISSANGDLNENHYDEPDDPTEYNDNDNESGSGIPQLATDRIRWHTPPTWDFNQVFPFIGGMAGVEYFEDGDWHSMHILGYMNNLGEIVIPVEHRHYPAMYAYRGAPPFSEGLVAIRSEDHGATGVFDTNGNLVIPFYHSFGWFFSHGLMAVSDHGGWEQTEDNEIISHVRWGFIDQQGNLVIPHQFENADDFREGLAPVMLGGYWGFIDTNGQIVIPPTFRAATTEAHGFPIIPHFRDGLAAVSIGEVSSYDGNWIDNTRWGFVDTQGNIAIPFEFAHAENFAYGVARVRMGGWGRDDEGFDTSHQWGVIDRDGNIVVPIEYTWISDFREGTAIAYCEYNMSIIDTQGNHIVPPGRFHSGRSFAEGFAAVSGYCSIGRAATAWGFIDRQGNEVVPTQFDFVEDFSHGFATVALGGWTVIDGVSVDTRRMGVIDTQGNIVIPIEFHDIRRFSEGLAWARYGDLWGILEIVDI